MQFADLAEQLPEILRKFSLDADKSRLAALISYLQLIKKWNKVYNLSAIRDEASMVTHHLLDSLVVVPYLQNVTRLADIGTGAGLPGMVVAIMRPELPVTLVDTVSKKTAFLQQVKIELKLDNVTVVNARVEAYQPPQLFDGIVSRAFAEMELFVRLTRHLLADNGLWYAMKGVDPQGEIAGLPADVRVKDNYPLHVPGLDAERHLVLLERH